MHRVIHEVLDKLPDEHSIRAISLDEELRGRRVESRAPALVATLVLVHDAGAGAGRAARRCTTPRSSASPGRRSAPTATPGPASPCRRTDARIAFESEADNLSAIDDNALVNIFVRDVGHGHHDAGQPEQRGRGGGRRLRQPGDLGRRAVRRVRVGGRQPQRRDDNNAVTNIYLHDTLDRNHAAREPGRADGAAADGDSGNPSVSGSRRGGRLRVAGDEPQRRGRRRGQGHLHAQHRAGHDRAHQPHQRHRRRAPTATRSTRRISKSGTADRVRVGRRQHLSPTTATSTRTSSWSSRGSGFFRHVSRTTAVGTVERARQRQLDAARDLRQRRVRRVHLDRHEPRRGDRSRRTCSCATSRPTTRASSAAWQGRGRRARTRRPRPRSRRTACRSPSPPSADNLSAGDNDAAHERLRAPRLLRDDDAGQPRDRRGWRAADGELVRRPRSPAAGDFVAFASDGPRPGAGPRTTRARTPPTGSLRSSGASCPIVPPPPVIPPDLGLNDHSAGHGGGGDTAATDRRPRRRRARGGRPRRDGPRRRRSRSRPRRREPLQPRDGQPAARQDLRHRRPTTRPAAVPATTRSPWAPAPTSATAARAGR